MANPTPSAAEGPQGGTALVRSGVQYNNITTMRLDLSGSKKLDHWGFSVKIYGPETDKSKRIVCDIITARPIAA